MKHLATQNQDVFLEGTLGIFLMHPTQNPQNSWGSVRVPEISGLGPGLGQSFLFICSTHLFVKTFTLHVGKTPRYILASRLFSKLMHWGFLTQSSGFRMCPSPEQNPIFILVPLSYFFFFFRRDLAVAVENFRSNAIPWHHFSIFETAFAHCLLRAKFLLRSQITDSHGHITVVAKMSMFDKSARNFPIL